MNKNLIRKAVIPIAGLGTRHFPASHAVKKNCSPRRRGGHRPRAVSLSPDELDAAGIQEICIIVSPARMKWLKNICAARMRLSSAARKYPALLREASR